MENIIDEIFNSKNLVQIKKSVLKLRNTINKLDDYLEKEEMLNLLKEKSKFIIDSNLIKFKYSNFIKIYNEDYGFSCQFANEILNLQKWEKLDELLNYLIDEYYIKLKTPNKNSKGILKEDIIKVLDILQEKYKLIDLINISEVSLDIFFLNSTLEDKIIDKSSNRGMDTVNYNSISNKNFAFFVYRVNDTIPYDSIDMLFSHFGGFIKSIIYGESQKAPQEFIDLCNSLDINVESETSDSIYLFTRFFSYINIIKKNSKIDTNNIKIFRVYYDNLIKNYFLKVNKKANRIIIPEEANCPCGSEKKYKNCCLKSDIIYLEDEDGKIYQEIQITDKIDEILLQKNAEYKLMYGRVPSEKEIISLGEIINNFHRINRKIKYEMPEQVDKMYAYFETGILLTEENIKNYPELEINKFKDKVREYQTLIEQEIIEEKGKLLQATEALNWALKKICDENIREIITTFNIFINDIVKSNVIPNNFLINNKNDFIVFCAYKLTKNLEALIILIDEGLNENCMAIVRFLYEILINVKVYTKDDELFNNKILPLAGLDKGTHFVREDQIVINKITKEEYNCYISISNLAKRSGKEYEELYKTLYKDSSAFIHVDAMKVSKIFSENNLFYDVDSCYLTGYISIIFCIDILYELINCKGVTPVIKKDIEYFCNNLLDLLDAINITLKLIYENENLYYILDKIRNNFNENFKINYERDNKIDLI